MTTKITLDVDDYTFNVAVLTKLKHDIKIKKQEIKQHKHSDWGKLNMNNWKSELDAMKKVYEYYGGLLWERDEL